MSVPQWLAQHLVDSGHWDVNGLGRKARGLRCRKCGEFTLAGYDADRCAAPAHVDPTPLSALGEAMALVGGRSTYALRRSAGGYRLDFRDRWHIAGKPAESPGQRFDVVAEHVCGSADQIGPLTTESVLQPTPPPEVTDAIPF